MKLKNYAKEQRMIDYLRSNWVELFAALGVFLTFATAVAKLTPSPKDDAVVSKIRTVFNFFSVNLRK